MSGNHTRRLTESLTELLEAFVELQDSVESELDSDSSVTEDQYSSEELESGLVNEVRNALELVLESDEFKVDDVATLISCITEALEEIDPSIFLQEDDEDEGLSSMDDDDDYLDDDDDDYDDYDDELDD